MAIQEERNIQKLILHIDDRVFELEKIARDGKHSRTISDALLDAARCLDKATKKINEIRKKRGMPFKRCSHLEFDRHMKQIIESPLYNELYVIPKGKRIVFNAPQCPKDYAVDVDSIKTARGFVQTVAHIREKEWCSPRVLAEFIAAANAALHNEGKSSLYELK